MSKMATFLHYIDDRSIWMKSPLALRFFIFLATSTIALFTSNSIILSALTIGMLVLLILNGYLPRNLKRFRLLVVTIILFAFFWIFLGPTGGETVFRLPWGHTVGQEALFKFFVATMRWLVVVLSGMWILTVTSEQELVRYLSQKLAIKYIILISTCLNTISYAQKDLELISYSYSSRVPSKKGILSKMQKVQRIATVLFLSNLKKIISLNETLALDEWRMK